MSKLLTAFVLSCLLVTRAHAGLLPPTETAPVLGEAGLLLLGGALAGVGGVALWRRRR